MMPRSVVVTNVGSEPGLSIARLLADTGDAVSTSVAEAVDAHGCVDGLVNCCRFDRLVVGPVEDLEPEEFWRGLSDNLSETFFTTQEAARQMLGQSCEHSAAHRRGCILNVTSVAAVVALPGQATWCASMAALTAATKVLATEWGARGIRVAAVGAGLTADLLPGLRELPGSSRRLPPGSLVEVSRVAETVRFVLSEAGAGIAGVPVYVDGGWLSDGYWESFPVADSSGSPAASAHAAT